MPRPRWLLPVVLLSACAAGDRRTVGGGGGVAPGGDQGGGVAGDQGGEPGGGQGGAGGPNEGEGEGGAGGGGEGEGEGGPGEEGEGEEGPGGEGEGEEGPGEEGEGEEGPGEEGEGEEGPGEEGEGEEGEGEVPPEDEIVVTGVEISDDGCADGCQGAGNGLPETGEDVSVLPVVESHGEVAFLSLSGVLEAVDPDIASVLGEPEQDFEELRPGDWAVPETPFRVRLAPGLADSTPARFLLHLADSRRGEVATVDVQFEIRGLLRVAVDGVFVDDDDVGDSNGDGDGLFDAGETIELQVDLINDGAVPFEGVRLGLRAAGDAADVLDGGPFDFDGRLAPGQVAEAAAEFPVAVEDEGRACLIFDLDILGDDGPLYHFEEIRCFDVGGLLEDLCEPRDEACDGVDNDCNGVTNDELPRAPDDVCADEGVCEGHRALCAGEEGWICDVPGTYQDEESRCDGLDNDCDGRVDEDAQPDGDEGCIDVGVCRERALACVAGGWDCGYPDEHEAVEASCDNLDNDCDGDVDEGLLNACGLCGQPPPGGCGDNCVDPTDIELDDDGHAFIESTTAQMQNDFATSCGNQGRGADVVFEFTLDEVRGRSVFRMEGAGRWDTVLELRRGPECEESAIVQCNDEGGIGTSQLVVDRLSPGDYWLIADGYAADDGGAFTLDVQIGGLVEPPANDTCDGVQLLNPPLDGTPVEVQAQVATAEADFPIPGCAEEFEGASGKDVVFEFAVEAPFTMFYSAAALHGGGAVAVWSSPECGPEAEVLECVVAEALPQSALTVRQDAGTYRLYATALADDADQARITLHTYPAPPAEQPGETCDDAVALELADAGGGALQGRASGNNLGAGDDHAGSCAGDGAEDVVYGFALESEAHVTVNMQTRAGRQVAWYLTGDCADPEAERFCRATEGVGQGIVLEAGQYFVIVDSPALNAGGPFDLTVTALPTPEIGETCDDPIPLEFDNEGVASVIGSTAAAANDHTANCAASANSPDLVYTFTLEHPVGPTTMTMETFEFGRWDNALYLTLAGCALGDIVQCDDDGPRGIGQSQLVFQRLEAGQYFLVADGYNRDESGTFSLVVNLGPSEGGEGEGEGEDPS